MEHFDEKQGIREKSLYTFHLDTPRVVIAVSVFLGVVALTFLLGMTLTKGDKVNSESLTASDLLASGRHDLNKFDHGLHSKNEPAEAVQPNSQVPQVKPQSDTGSAPLSSNKPVNDNDLFSPSINYNEPPINGISANDSPKHEKHEKNEKIAEKKKEKKEAKKNAKIAAKENAASGSRVKKDAPKKKSSVVPVVSESKNPGKGSFAVQVASYDKRSKAANEIENLKKLNYNAYMNDILIDGKQFFRVRIGPLSSKEKAAAIVDEIHDKDRYASSYVVKE